MNELVFLVEERSMVEVLRVVVPQIVPPEVLCRYVPHEGWTDLQKSIPRKLRAWTNPDARFVVLRDQDAWDCRELKVKLQSLCPDERRAGTTVRIVCHQLESWFLGDLAAVERAFSIQGVARQQNKAKFRDPDGMPNAVQLLRSLVPRYQRIAGSRAIAKHITLDDNRSHSFHVFINALRSICSDTH